MEISRHAKNNMRLYEISEEAILSAIESPDFSAEEGERIVALKKFEGKFSGFPLKVVYKRFGSAIFLITTYPLKKKMWR